MVLLLFTFHQFLVLNLCRKAIREALAHDESQDVADNFDTLNLLSVASQVSFCCQGLSDFVSVAWCAVMSLTFSPGLQLLCAVADIAKHRH